MEFLFFLSDFFSWTCIILLVIWVAVLTPNVVSLRKTIERLTQIPESKTTPAVRQEIPAEEQGTVIQEQKHAPEPVIHTDKPVYAAQKETSQVETTAKPVNMSRPKNTVENFFLGNFINKIGALAIIVALVIFIKLVSSYIVFTAAMKIALGFISGLILYLGGLKLHTGEKLKGFSEVLTGTGFAAFFITTYCAYYLNVFNSLTAILTGGVLLLAVFITAQGMHTFSPVVIGLAGGYLTPFLSGAHTDAGAIYLIFLNLVSIIYTLVNPKTRWINSLNLSLTMLIMIIGGISDVSKIYYPITLWAVYVLYDIIRNRESRTDNVTSTLNYIFLTLTTLLLFNVSTEQVGIMYGITALIYSVLAFFGKRFQNPLYKRYEHFIFLNAWFSILFTLNDIYSVIAWSVIALLLSFAVKKDKFNAVKHYITFYYLSAIFGVLLAKDGSAYIIASDYTPVFNMRTLIFAIPILSMILSINRLKFKESLITNLMRFGITFLSYCYIISEANGLINGYSHSNPEAKTGYLLLSICIIAGFLYSVFCHSVSKKTKFALFNVAGHLLGALSVLILVISEVATPMSTLPVVNMRIAAYIACFYYCGYYAKIYKTEFFKYLGIAVGFLFCAAEGLNVDRLLNTGYMATGSWILYSAAVTLTGIMKNKKFLINSGIWMIILTILRIFVYDLASVETVYKIGAFLALGIILMIISYIYIKHKSE